MSGDERTPWLLFMPDGLCDGLIWSPKTEEEAGRKFARMSRRQWASMVKEGYTTRLGKPGEHLELIADWLLANATEVTQ